MSITRALSFEQGIHPDNFTHSNVSFPGAIQTGGRTGTYAYGIPGRSASTLSHGSSFDAAGTLSSPAGRVIIGFGYRPAVLVAANFVISFGANLSATYLAQNPDGSVQIIADGNVLATAPAGTLTINTWSYLELEMIISNTAGLVRLWKDNINVAEFTGDTYNLGGADTAVGTTRTIKFQSGGTGHDNGVYNLYDDVVVIMDDSVGTVTRIGPVKLHDRVPTSDSAVAMTRSAGAANYETVDDRPVSSTDFVSTVNAGLEDLYGHAAWTESNNILGVVPWVVASNATGTLSVAPIVKSGAAATVVGPAVGINTSVNNVRHGTVIENDPNTAAPWTGAAITAVKSGVRSVSL